MIFGLAAATVFTVDTRRRSRHWHEYRGAFANAPPEVLAEGASQYRPPAADVWGLGIILFWLLLGYAPFDTTHDNRSRLPLLRSEEDFQFLNSIGVTALIFGCLASDPQKRPTIREVRSHPWLQDDHASPSAAPHVGPSSAAAPSHIPLLPPAVPDDQELSGNSPLSWDNASTICPVLPEGHVLDPDFVRTYLPGEALGQGGFGFVIKAYNRVRRQHVAVKFIRKDKVFAWAEDEELGEIPLEVKIMKLAVHENITRCLDIFQDDTFIYIVRISV